MSEALQTFDADDKGRPDSEGYMSHGDIIRLVAVCACKHRWGPRGIRQISNIDGYKHQDDSDATPPPSGR